MKKYFLFFISILLGIISIVIISFVIFEAISLKNIDAIGIFIASFFLILGLTFWLKAKTVAWEEQKKIQEENKGNLGHSGEVTDSK